MPSQCADFPTLFQPATHADPHRRNEACRLGWGKRLGEASPLRSTRSRQAMGHHSYTVLRPAQAEGNLASPRRHLIESQTQLQLQRDLQGGVTSPAKLTYGQGVPLTPAWQDLRHPRHDSQPASTWLSAKGVAQPLRTLMLDARWELSTKGNPFVMRAWAEQAGEGRQANFPG